MRRLTELEANRSDDRNKLRVQNEKITKLEAKAAQDEKMIIALEVKQKEEGLLLHSLCQEVQAVLHTKNSSKIYTYFFGVKGYSKWVNLAMDEKRSAVWHLGYGKPHIYGTLGICDNKGKKCIYAALHSCKCHCIGVVNPVHDTTTPVAVKVTAVSPEVVFSGPEGVESGREVALDGGDSAEVGKRNFNLNGKNDEWKRCVIDMRNTRCSYLEEKELIVDDQIMIKFEINLGVIYD